MESPSESQISAILVEDESVTRTIFANLLKKHNFNVREFADGTSANEYLASVTEPCCLILDWQLPGMNGLELLKEIQQSQSPFMVKILVTGSSDKSLIRQALRYGADDFLMKPLDPQQFGFRLEIARSEIFKYYEQQVESRYLKMRANEMESLARTREDQLVHADKLATLGTLAAGVAHEINNPTTFISGNLQVLEKYWQVLDPLLQEARDNHPELSAQLDFISQELPSIFQEMHNGIHRISTITKGLKQFVHKSDAIQTFQPCQLKRVIANSVRFAKPMLDSRITINLNLDVTDDRILGDQTQIEQIAINLLVNASHALVETSAPEISVTLEEQEDYLLLRISDNGHGMDQRTLSKIWEPFFTTKGAKTGTGLGLPIVHSIVQAHHGSIAVFSQEHLGTSFCIQFPTLKTAQALSEISGGL